MSSAFTRRGAALCALLVGLALLAGCGEDRPRFEPVGGPDLTTKNFFPAVTDAMVEAGTAHVLLQVTDASGQQAVRTEGVQRIAADAAQSGMSITSQMAGGDSSSMIVVGRTVYVAYDQLTGGKYVAVDLDDTSDPLASNFAGLAGSADLASQIRQFQDAVVSVRRVDTDATDDGADAATYRVVVDASRLQGDAAANAQRAGLRRISYEFQIDAKRLVRNLAVNTPGARVLMTFDRWGAPVEISAPRRGEMSQRTAQELFGAGAEQGSE